MTESPCRRCSDRVTGETTEDCHEDCEKYQCWRAERIRLQELIREEEKERGWRSFRHRLFSARRQRWKDDDERR
jgi:hypothetical protein